MAENLKFKAVCFDWGNTLEIGRPLIMDTVLHIWQKFISGIKYEDVLDAAQDAWSELAKIAPNREDLKDMGEFRQMIYARQAELMANTLGFEPDIPDWPWIVNVFFNEHYFKNRTWRIPRAHARLLRKLRAAEVPMSIIANNDDPAELPTLISELGLTGFFVNEIASSSFGHSKPHPEIYLAALDQFDLRADEVLFVGDDYHNDYWGPEQVGMYPILFDPQKLRARVEGIRRIENLEEILDYLLPS